MGMNGMGRPDETTRVLVRLAAALTVDESAQLEFMDEAARVAPEAAEEVLLQSYLFLGFPVALNALGLWRRRTGRPPPEPVEGEVDGARWMERGEAVCQEVYAHQYEALREVMQGIHPELDRWALTEGYGKVLGRPGLDLGRRELCVVAMLAGIDASRQLHAHLRGCLNVGVSPEEAEAVLNEVAAITGPDRAAAAGRIWRKVLARASGSRDRS
jgi:4-carboxymuconolactone decarboxylase